MKRVIIERVGVDAKAFDAASAFKK